jgi:hypothetical protein
MRKGAKLLRNIFAVSRLCVKSTTGNFTLLVVSTA